MIFSSPSFLWALGLIAIPIIVHLFQFRRFKRLDFSDVSLLREIQTKSQTKNQLKHLLVLAARILFLAALIFAFAEPILPGKSDLAKQKPLISIYVDNSLSMQNRSGDGKLLQLALQRAFDISESYPKESKFQLITNDLTSNQRRFVDRESFLELLDEVEMSPQFQPASHILDFHRQAKNDAELQQSSILYLLSDFNNTLDSMGPNADTTTQVRVVPFRGVLTQNVSVDSAWITTPIVQKDKEIEVHYKVSNRGSQLQDDISVTISAAGNIVNSSIFSLEAHSSLDTFASFIPVDTGYLKGKITLEDSPIEFDNTLNFEILVQPNIRVVEISQSNNPGPFSKLFDQSNYDYSSMGSNQIQQDVLDKNGQPELVILNGIENWNSGLFSRLNSLGENGKNALIVLPKKITESSKALFEKELSIRFVKWDTNKMEANLIQLNDPLYSEVFEDQPKNLNFPYTRGHWQLNAAGIESLIQLYDGSSLLSAMQNGRGRIFFITTEFNDALTNFHKHALFVPSLLNMTLSSGQGQRLAHKIGSKKLTLSDRIPEGSKIVSEQDSFSFYPGITYDGILLNDMIKMPGYYRLTSDKNDEIASYAFNYDRKESNLEPISSEQIQSKMASLGDQLEILEIESENLNEAIISADLGTKLWPIFLALSIIFLLVESILIKRFTK